MEFFKGVQIGGALFGSKAAVQIAADSDVVGDGLEGGEVLLRRICSESSRGSNIRALRTIPMTALALVGCDGAAVGMAGPNGAVEAFEAFLESFVCEVSDVENSSHLVHIVEKASSAGCEVSFGICAGGVSPCS